MTWVYPCPSLSLLVLVCSVRAELPSQATHVPAASPCPSSAPSSARTPAGLLPSAATECCFLAPSPIVALAGSASLQGSVQQPGSPSGGCWSPQRLRALAGRAQARAARRCSCTGHAGLGVPGGAHQCPALASGPQLQWLQQGGGCPAAWLAGTASRGEVVRGPGGSCLTGRVALPGKLPLQL